jgi:hypothetical protein
MCTHWMYRYCVLYLAWWWLNEPKHVAEFLILITNICCIYWQEITILLQTTGWLLSKFFVLSRYICSCQQYEAPLGPYVKCPKFFCQILTKSAEFLGKLSYKSLISDITKIFPGGARAEESRTSVTDGQTWRTCFSLFMHMPLKIHLI